jgi:beta-glucosidase
LLRQPAWPLLRPQWQRVTGVISWLTSHASAREGGDFAAGDRTDLRLSTEQVALIRAVAAANPRTVVVLMGGGAILCSEWDQLVPGLLLLWYPGEQGGHALADVLFGAVSPSGRLPFALPTSEAALPPFEPRARRVVYDLWHGYRRLQRLGQGAAYPFGFGLSYSSFARNDAKAVLHHGIGEGGWVELVVCVRNSGERPAADVVQVYLEPPGVVLERPRRSLVAFQRVSLEPDETRRLTLTIPLRRLAYFAAERDSFALEAGLHRLVVAPHAEAPGVTVDLELEAAMLGP